ncbi:MAG: hydroxymethylbilane synthase [Firmicutes bacterium]|nr:hydroxymethylbilane synthase [Bacillota bacterium]
MSTVGHREIRVGTRGSLLARRQTEWVVGRLEQLSPQQRFRLVVVETHGDRVADLPLTALGGQGVFVKELERALEQGEIDLAVHSLKDMTTALPPGLELAAVPKRVDPRDVFISSRHRSLQGVPLHGRIGTGSLRRVAQLKHWRPDLELVPIRGNLDTRLRKMDSLGLDGLVLAWAGLERLGWADRVAEIVSPDVILPAVGQGALGLEIRADDEDLRRLLQPLNDPDTLAAVTAERAFLARLQGGCHAPVGALGQVAAGRLRLEGMVADPEGTKLWRQRLEGPASQAKELGTRLAEALLQQGAGRILAQLEPAAGAAVEKVWAAGAVGRRSAAPGTVYLVGAGPGDPGLLTLRAKELLERADVVVYDRLAHPGFLEWAPARAEKIYVGKESSHHSLPQDQINRLLAEKAAQGLQVVRLKGGDPFVFGRGGEEAEFLRQRGIPVEVVPGVTSAVAVPAYAGIPVTQRGVATSVAILTGHEDPTKERPGVDWARVAQGADTLVLLMGVENLPQIAAALVRHGRPPETPVALIRWGTTPRQETLTGTLADIAQKAKEACFGPPAVIVVGSVVQWRDKIGWFEKKPLFGRRIVITRSRQQASALRRRLEEAGAWVWEFPTIRTEPLLDNPALEQAMARLAEYAWVVFTSANGVEFTWQALVRKGLDARAFGQAKLAAIGPATAEALAQHGLKADLVPDTYQAEALAAALLQAMGDPAGTDGAGGAGGKRVLVARAAEAREALVAALEAAGVRVDAVAVYRTVPAQAGPGGGTGEEGAAGDDAADASTGPAAATGDGRPPGLVTGRQLRSLLQAHQVDAVTFTSSSTARNFLASLGGAEAARPLLEGVALACIGPITARTLQDEGFAPAVIARDYTVAGLVEALEHWATGGGAAGKRSPAP